MVFDFNCATRNQKVIENLSTSSTFKYSLWLDYISLFALHRKMIKKSSYLHVLVLLFIFYITTPVSWCELLFFRFISMYFYMQTKRCNEKKYIINHCAYHFPLHKSMRYIASDYFWCNDTANRFWWQSKVKTI